MRRGALTPASTMDWIVRDLILLLIALAGIPAGILISKYTKEEIRKGKLELKILMISCAVLFLISALFNFPEQSLVMTVLGFIFTLSFVSLRKA